MRLDTHGYMNIGNTKLMYENFNLLIIFINFPGREPPDPLAYHSYWIIVEVMETYAFATYLLHLSKYQQSKSDMMFTNFVSLCLYLCICCSIYFIDCPNMTALNAE